MTYTGDVRRLVVAMVLIALAAATAFGLWHVVIGGLINGNPRAAGFGIALATGAGALLAVIVTRMRGRPGG